jgi:hypothetical protein
MTRVLLENIWIVNLACGLSVLWAARAVWKAGRAPARETARTLVMASARCAATTLTVLAMRSWPLYGWSLGAVYVASLLLVFSAAALARACETGRA